MATMAASPRKKQNGSWPQRLKAIRRRLRLTQSEAAARIHISGPQWVRFETGERVPTKPIAFLIELLEKSIV